MRNCRFLPVGFCLLAALMTSSCGGTGSTSGTGTQSAGVFTMATDSPTLPSIVSAQVSLASITLSDGTGSTPTANLLTNPPEMVDFAKLNGLHGLVDVNNVTPGPYSTANILVSGVTIQYLDTSVSPPTLTTVSATVQPMNVSVPLDNSVVINNSDFVGFFMDLDLGQSIQIAADGTITFNPTFDVNVISADDANAYIDELPGGVMQASSDGSSFTMQGPHGRIYTVDVTSQTNIDTTDPVSSFTTNTIVEVSGTLNRVTRDIQATDIVVVSSDHFVVEGLNTFVQTSGGQVNGVNLYARAELPDLAGYPLGAIDPIALTGSERYMIANLPLSSLVLSSSNLLAGQRLTLGGALNTSNAPPTLSVHRVIFDLMGQRGTWAIGSTVINADGTATFGLNDNYLAGVLLPQPLTVQTEPFTKFINLSGLSALSGSTAIPLRVVGFIFVDPVTQVPTMFALRVQQMNHPM
jgi:hypothetical protein